MPEDGRDRETLECKVTEIFSVLVFIPAMFVVKHHFLGGASAPGAA